MKKITILFLILPFAYQFLDAQTEQWSLAKSKDGIEVYLREANGTKLKEFKATVLINTKIQTLETLIDNVQDYSKWQPNGGLTKVIKKIDENDRYLYITANLPWPLSNRDVIFHSVKSWNSTKQELRFLLSSSPKLISPQKGYIRVEETNGKWEFITQPDGKIQVVYQLFFDPGGEIPKWLLNMDLIDNPYETLFNLREMAEK